MNVVNFIYSLLFWALLDFGLGLVTGFKPFFYIAILNVLVVVGIIAHHEFKNMWGDTRDDV